MTNIKKINEVLIKNRKSIGIILLALILLSFYFVLVTSSFKIDDLIYMTKWNSSEKLQSINDIINYQYNHYFSWGGRTVAHTLLQLLLIIPKPLSALIITLCLLALGIVMYKLVYLGTKLDYLKIACIIGLLYFLNPASDETLFWYTGIANYMLTMLIMLLAIYPFILVLNNIKLNSIHYCLIPIAFFAGWCNENMSTTLVFIMFTIIIYLYKKNKKIEPALMIALVLGTIGCCLLIFAPGNFARANTFAGGLMTIMYRGYGQLNAWFNWLLIPIVLFIATSKVQENNMFKLEKNIFTLWGILSILAMLAAPVYPSRAVFGSLVLIIISILINIKNNDKLNRNKLTSICILIALGFIFTCLCIGVLQYVRGMGVYIPG